MALSYLSMPIPVSSISTLKRFLARIKAFTVITPSLGVNFMAFEMKLLSTWLIISESRLIFGSSSLRFNLSAILVSFIFGWKKIKVSVIIFFMSQSRRESSIFPFSIFDTSRSVVTKFESLELFSFIRSKFSTSSFDHNLPFLSIIST